MKVVLYGASGMIGQGVLRECLLASDVDAVLAIGRSPLPEALTWPALDPGQRAKLRQITLPDPGNLSTVEPEVTGFDACFFCLGVSSAGMSEAAYRTITRDLTLSAAGTIVRLNPGMVFVFVSGANTDSSEKGRAMWARVKGETENALLRMPFRAAYMFRPGGIIPMHGIVSKTRAYRIGYVLTKPLWPVLRALFPRQITTTEQIGRAMLRVTREGYPTPILEAPDICGL